MSDNGIKEKDTVIFKRGDTCRSFQIRKNRQVFFEKNKFSVDDLIGQSYGSTFEIDKGKLIKVTKETPPEYDSNVPEVSTDNRDLRDLDSNQKLSKEDIMKMKEKGIAGEKIIEELIENSETFKTKTEFSQAKYLKKKKKRHIVSFTVLRPTARLVLKIFAKEPQKICNLRVDTLSQMLNFSNIMCGSRVAVVETCQGLVLSCVLQRLGGQGKLIQLTPNTSNQVCRKAMDYFSLSKEDYDSLYIFPMSVLADLKENHNQSFTTDDDGLKQEASEEGESSSKRLAVDNELKEEVVTSDGGNTGDDDDKSNSCDTGDVERMDASDNNAGGREDNNESKAPVSNRILQRGRRSIRHKEAAEIIMSKKLDSLIIACKYNPAPIVKMMMDFLPLSRPVVVFCHFLEPLLEIYTHIKDTRTGLQLKLSENWLREYQILPQRTHPMMNMNGNGGYLLTFITCDPNTC